jgi:CheY-like chemotaxis protein
MYLDVLLIEHDLGEVVLIRDAVNRLTMPVNLHVALDGHQALLMLSNPHFQPDLIVLDLNIPKMSGTALLAQLKDIRTPVVVLSPRLIHEHRNSASHPTLGSLSGSRSSWRNSRKRSQESSNSGGRERFRQVARWPRPSGTPLNGAEYRGCRTVRLHLSQRRTSGSPAPLPRVGEVASRHSRLLLRWTICLHILEPARVSPWPSIRADFEFVAL